MNGTRLAVSLLACMLAAASPAAAVAPTCAAADHSYRLVQRETTKALTAYAICVAEAFGRDECTARFTALADAQRRFAQVVSDVRNRCGQ